MFIKEIYETLRASPQWNQTLMVVTYDEHGGFFDHVPTPVDGVPSPDGIVGPPPYNFTFDRLGVRVPAILISPWIEKGTGNLFSQLILVSAINHQSETNPFQLSMGQRDPRQRRNTSIPRSLQR
jgi:hypothetical protein